MKLCVGRLAYQVGCEVIRCFPGGHGTRMHEGID